MNATTRALAIIAGFAVLVGGCDAASHLKSLQPPSVPSGPPVSLPSTAPPVTAQTTGFQRGIDIDWYTFPGQNVTADAAATIAYIRSLHANAVSISFPFFMDGQASGSVHGTTATPTPEQLAVVVADARQAGLYVSLRPLLDERSLGVSRVHWVPGSEPAWFASYRRWLKPYARMAQRQHVGELIVGTEFSGFQTDPGWAGLDRSLRHVYKGTLACAENWDSTAPGGCSTATETTDAYPPVSGSLSLGWRQYDGLLGYGRVLTEVGIAAVPGAHTRPYRTRWHGRRVDPGEQKAWFGDACRAAVETHLGGIYFWSVGLAQHQPDGPTSASQTTWTNSAGARAISACFERIGH